MCIINIVPGVYISFPFCAHKCTYCNFASGVFPRSLEDDYQRSLVAEIKGHLFAWSPETVYLGGGTPSSMDLPALEAVLAAVPGRPWKEATLEAAPGTITPERARAWVAGGIDRASLELLQQTIGMHPMQTSTGIDAFHRSLFATRRAGRASARRPAQGALLSIDARRIGRMRGDAPPPNARAIKSLRSAATPSRLDLNFCATPADFKLWLVNGAVQIARRDEKLHRLFARIITARAG